MKSTLLEAVRGRRPTSEDELAVAREPPKPICATDGEAAVWADAWWRDYESKVKSHANLYFDPEQLFTLLEPASFGGESLAPVKLMRLSWLLRRATKLRRAQTDEQRLALALPRRQWLEEHEPEAFLTPADVRALPRQRVGDLFETCGPNERCGGWCSAEDAEPADKPLKLLSISHGWLTPEHPDPLGQQLVGFAEQVRHERSMLRSRDEDCGTCCRDVCAYMLCCGVSQGCCCWVVPCAGQPCGQCMHQLPAGEMAVFYDFTSLHQKDAHGQRTLAERGAFGTALETMGVWYAHRLTTTCILSRLPPGWPQRAEDAPFFPAGWLQAKGWPTFERAVSGQIKRASVGSWQRIIDPEVKQEALFKYQQAPLHPRAFAARLARAIFTNGRSDCDLVAGLYADTFAGAFGRLRKLEYANARWTDEEMVQLAEALPLALELTDIYLAGMLESEIGTRGLEALTVAISAGAAPKLATFCIVLNVRVSRMELDFIKKMTALVQACNERGIAFGTVA